MYGCMIFPTDRDRVGLRDAPGAARDGTDVPVALVVSRRFATRQEPLQAIGEDKWGKSPGSRV